MLDRIEGTIIWVLEVSVITGLAGTLALVSLYLLGQTPPALPPDQGRHGLTDAQLYDAIISDSGNPLGDMSFSDAVLRDPRRIDGLILQRVVGPLYLAIAKIRYPQMDVSGIQGAMRHAYLQRNADLRRAGAGGIVSAEELAKDYERSWKANGQVLSVAFEISTPAAGVFKELLRANRQDIRRAFRESAEIAGRAGAVSQEKDSQLGWAEIVAILKNMSDMIEQVMVEGLGLEVIDDEILWIQSVPEETMGMDLFGALSMDQDDDEDDEDDEDDDDDFGALGSVSLFEEEDYGLDSLDEAIDLDLAGDDDDDDDDFGWQYEEHIVSGHRAPAVALPQYRKMGGRFYG